MHDSIHVYRLHDDFRRDLSPQFLRLLHLFLLKYFKITQRRLYAGMQGWDSWQDQKEKDNMSKNYTRSRPGYDITASVLLLQQLLVHPPFYGTAHQPLMS
jgi:hypothetical protein